MYRSHLVPFRRFPPLAPTSACRCFLEYLRSGTACSYNSLQHTSNTYYSISVRMVRYDTTCYNNNDQQSHAIRQKMCNSFQKDLLYYKVPTRNAKSRLKNVTFRTLPSHALSLTSVSFAVLISSVYFKVPLLYLLVLVRRTQWQHHYY